VPALRRVLQPRRQRHHYISLERFARPGDVLLGADSYTTTSGALGMIAIGAGGLDVAPAERCACREYGEAPERS
jgi:aconitase A